MKTEQEVFSYVLGFLRKQGHRSVIHKGIGNGSCAYRGEDGAMCAAGCLIPDEFYHRNMEGKAVHYIDDLPEYLRTGNILELASELQFAHDVYMPAKDVTTPYRMDNWEKCMKETAKRRKLTYKENV